MNRGKDISLDLARVVLLFVTLLLRKGHNLSNRALIRDFVLQGTEVDLGRLARAVIFAGCLMALLAHSNQASRSSLRVKFGLYPHIFLHFLPLLASSLFSFLAIDFIRDSLFLHDSQDLSLFSLCGCCSRLCLFLLL